MGELGRLESVTARPQMNARTMRKQWGLDSVPTVAPILASCVAFPACGGVSGAARIDSAPDAGRRVPFVGRQDVKITKLPTEMGGSYVTS